MKLQRNLHALFQVTLAAVSLLAVLGLAGSALGRPAYQPALAAPERQIPIYTPTPGPDGRIIYIVKANDTLMSISLLTGVSVEKLRELNNMSGDTIFPGQQLLIGLSGPLEVTPTTGPTPTPTAILPTPSPKPGVATLCVILFNDLNGDSIRQDTEVSIPDGAISFGNRTGTYSKSITTGVSEEHTCFADLPEGNYTVSVAVPEGYNPTTGSDVEADLQALDTFYVNFGAQANSQTEANTTTIAAPEGGRSPILGIIGGLFLLAGVGVAVFAGRMLRNR